MFVVIVKRADRKFDFLALRRLILTVPSRSVAVATLVKNAVGD
jgi:hypothetical protein